MTAPHIHRLREVEGLIARINTLIGADTALDTRVDTLEAIDADARLDALEAATGAWTSYTPTLTSSGTNPTLGSGSITVGKYKILGTDLVVAKFFIKFGTSGVSAGTGAYIVGGWPAIVDDASGSGSALPVGSARVVDDTGGGSSEASFIANGRMLVGGANVTSSTPFTWAASDEISGTIVGELA